MRGRVLRLAALVSLLLVGVGSVEAASKPKRKVSTTRVKSKSSKVSTTVPVVVPTTSAKVPFRLVNMCDVLNRLDVKGILPASAPDFYRPISFENGPAEEGAWLRPEVQVQQAQFPRRDSVCVLGHQGPGRETQDLGIGQFANWGEKPVWIGGRPFEVKVEGVLHRVYRENPPGNAVLSKCRLFVVLPFGVFLTQVAYNRQAESAAQVDCGPAEELLRRALVLLESGPLVYIDN
jgi:hypothetical protein